MRANASGRKGLKLEDVIELTLEKMYPKGTIKMKSITLYSLDRRVRNKMIKGLLVEFSIDGQQYFGWVEPSEINKVVRRWIFWQADLYETKLKDIGKLASISFTWINPIFG